MMRRLVAAFSLVLVVTGATWCVDGCKDPSDRRNSSAPMESSCTICVVPFAVTPEFDLAPDAMPVHIQNNVLASSLLSAPPLSIDHPPRAL